MQRSISKLSKDCPVCLEKTGCAAKGQEGWLQLIVQLQSHCAFRGKDDGGGYLSVSLHGFVKHPWRGLKWGLLLQICCVMRYGSPADKKSTIEEVFLGSRCYTSQETLLDCSRPDNRSSRAASLNDRKEFFE